MNLTLGDKSVNLNEGETLIWEGQPVQGILRNPLHIGIGLAFAALGIWAAVAMGRQGAIAAVPLLLIGVYLFYFNALVEKNRRAMTYYALTNQRALLGYSLRVLAMPITPHTEIDLTHGTYDTVFITPERPRGVMRANPIRKIGFGHLEDGTALFALMKDIQKGIINGA